jgi:hypothetical protein
MVLILGTQQKGDVCGEIREDVRQTWILARSHDTAP